jgi:hypothetical protein
MCVNVFDKSQVTLYTPAGSHYITGCREVTPDDNEAGPFWAAGGEYIKKLYHKKGGFGNSGHVGFGLRRTGMPAMPACWTRKGWVMAPGVVLCSFSLFGKGGWADLGSDILATLLEVDHTSGGEQ